jgi:Ca-activated chloride channel family protein
MALPAGTYVVEAREGPARAKATVAVSDAKPTVLLVNLDTGALRARAFTAKGNVPLSNANVSITRPVGDPGPNAAPGEMVSAFSGTDGVVLLPAGRYLVRAEAGLARAQKVVEIKAGASTVIDLPLDAGVLQLSAGQQPPGTTPSQQPAAFAVLEDDPDAPRGRREVLRTAQKSPDIVVPPGTYTIELRQGGIETRERVTVASGEVVRRTLTLPAGQVSLSTRLGAQTLTDQVFYFIERIDGAGSETSTTTSRAQPTLLLAAGRYRIESRLGAMNARTAREVEVRPGAPAQQVVFEQAAGSMRLRAQNPPGEVFWDVRDSRGQPVWSTGQPEPELTLQAGQYLVRAFARDRQVERTFDLRAGERRNLEVGFE